MITADGKLHIYMVNVGQGDTTVIVTPKGKIIVVDAMRPTKLVRLLNDLGLNNGDPINHMIITHPHSDHFSGANRLAQDFTILQATVAPFWHTFGMGPPTYQKLITRLYEQNTNITFLSGYSRWYPEGSMTTSADNINPEVDKNAPYIEMLGPTNGMVRILEDANIFNTNHLSIILRIRWKKFRMIISGDAQMENWSHFDHERMMEDNCNILRASHHGSSNGTQWERLERLKPSDVIVSSDPFSGHHLPDLSAAAVFLRFDNSHSRMAVLTADSGTIHLEVNSNLSSSRNMRCFKESPYQNIDLGNAETLSRTTNPTDWANLLHNRIQSL